MTVKPKTVHPDRYAPTTHLRKIGVVIHDAESSDVAAQTLCDVMAKPGDRPSPTRPGKFYGASYHAVTTNDPRDVPYVLVQGADHAPDAAPPVNATWWHICMPGRANQGAEGWADEPSEAGIRGVAKFIVDMGSHDGFPLERCSVSDLLAGDGGYCGHVDVSNAWHDTDHTDPGPTFPWAQLADEITKLTELQPPTPAPGDDDEVSNIRFVRHTGYINVFMVGAGPALSITEELMASYPADTPKIFYKDANLPALKAMCFQSGLDMADNKQLVPGGDLTKF